MKKDLLRQQLKAVSGRTRLEILSYLKKNHSATVGGIAEAVDRAENTVSINLGILESLGIVARRQRGKYAAYRLSLHQEQPIRQILSML